MNVSDLIAMGALDDILGADEDILGAVRRRAGRAPVRSPLRAAAAARALPAARGNALSAVKSTLFSGLPGAPEAGGRVEPLGFGSFTFGPATAQTAQLTGKVNAAAKGKRLVISQAVVGAPGALVLLTSAFVGRANQVLGAQALPVEAFGPGAFGVDINWDPATPGIDIVLNFATTAVPAAMTSITVSPVLFCLTYS